MVGLCDYPVHGLERHTQPFDCHLPPERQGRDDVDVQRIGAHREDGLGAAAHEDHAAFRRGLRDHALGHQDESLLFRVDRYRGLAGDERLRRRRGERAGEAFQQPGGPLLPPGDLVPRESRKARDLIDELVVDQCPAAAKPIHHQPRDLRPARGVLARDRDERFYCWRRLRRRSPIFSSGMPPCVGTRITRLLLAFSSRSTSKYCRVSASGVSVVLSSRCCSACRRATSTRWRSVSTCCSCAILLLIAWTTCAGGW